MIRYTGRTETCLIKTILTFLVLASSLIAQTRPATTADFDRWMKELSNWGRWGKADELGTLNLVTPATRLAAAKLVREGAAISPRRRQREGA
jgi:hypothetical protein